MVCLFCQHKITDVINSRQHASRPQVWRRRRCRACQAVFTTYETPAAAMLPTVESPKPQVFSTARLMVSLYHELPENDERPDTAWELAQTVTQHLLAMQLLKLSPEKIAQTACATLLAYDKPSAMRYGLRYKLVEL